MNNSARLLVFLLIFLNLLPGGFVRDTVDVGHFFSTHHIFEYAFHHGFRYGIDIIDNVGPYGYLHYPYTYAGGAYWTKTLWFALICFVYAYYATVLASRIHNLPGKLLFLFPVIFFPLQVAAPWYSFEIVPRLATFFSAFYFLKEPIGEDNRTERGHIIFNGLFYALLTLEKASNAYYLAFLVFTLSAYWLLQSRWRCVFWLAGSYLSGIALFWLAAGQRLSGIPVYFESMRFFINSYQEIMTTEMGERNFHYALFYCGVAAILVIYRLTASFSATRTRFPAEVFRSILVAALFFLSWKQGVLRNVNSYGTFVYTVPVLFAFLCLYPIAAGTGNSEGNLFTKRFSLRSISIFRGSLLASLLLVIWSNVVGYEKEIDHKVGIFQEFSARFSDLVSYRPAQNLRYLDAKFKALKSENALPPPLKKTMQSARVDEFGSTPEILLLNDLNYRPRPVPIDFIVGNSALNDKNGRFYQDPATAPDFVFLPDFGLRLADTSAYLGLLFNYHAVQSFRNWLVMKRRPGGQRLEIRKLQENPARFDEWVSLTDFQKSFLWVEIDASPTTLGRVKNFLYKPDLIRLDLMLDNGSTQSFPVSLSQLRSGFLISPVIKTRDSLKWSAHDKSEVPWNLAKAFRISLDSPAKNSLFHPDFKVIFSGVATVSSSDPRPIPVDLHRAMALIDLFAPDFPASVTNFPVDLFANEARDDFYVEGLSGLESNGKENWRWALGPATRIKFYVDPVLPERARQLLLKFAFKNGVPIADQTVAISLNGKDIRRFSSEEIATSDQIDADVVLPAQKGLNLLEIAYQDWNHGKRDYGNDPRQLAVVIMRLSLQEAH